MNFCNHKDTSNVIGRGTFHFGEKTNVRSKKTAANTWTTTTNYKILNKKEFLICDQCFDDLIKMKNKLRIKWGLYVIASIPIWFLLLYFFSWSESGIGINLTILGYPVLAILVGIRIYKLPREVKELKRKEWTNMTKQIIETEAIKKYKLYKDSDEFYNYVYWTDSEYQQLKITNQ